MPSPNDVELFASLPKPEEGLTTLGMRSHFCTFLGMGESPVFSLAVLRAVEHGLTATASPELDIPFGGNTPFSMLVVSHVSAGRGANIPWPPTLRLLHIIAPFSLPLSLKAVFPHAKAF